MPASTEAETARFRVVIAGGGVAALETAFALQELGGGRLDVALVAPDDDFVYRPIAVLEPFVMRPPRRVPLAELAAGTGAGVVQDALAAVDAERRRVTTTSGSEIAYDALAVTVGARARECLVGALTLDVGRIGESLRGLLAAIESGSISRVAFVVPTARTWPLPAYELALLTAAYAREVGAEHEVSLVTVEPAPLAVFGTPVGDGVAELLADAGIELVTGATVAPPTPETLEVGPGASPLRVDRVIAMPELVGPGIAGLPSDSNGFVPVEADGAVRGAEHVYAAGDVTDFPVKQGGVAGQQGALIATAIAALAGEAVEPVGFAPTLTGILLTGAKPRYLTARLTGEGVRDSSISSDPAAARVAKIGAPRLGAYLDRRWASTDAMLFGAASDPLALFRRR